MDDLSIGAFWGPSPLDIGVCASTMIDVVRRLQSYGHPFDRLFYGRDSPKEPVVEFTPSLEAVTERLNVASRYRGILRPDLGIVVSLDEGLQKWAQTRITFSCGETSPQLWNSVTLRLCSDSNGSMDTPETIRRVLVDLVEATSPDWARVDDFRRMDTGPAPSRPMPTIGWMLFLDVSPATLPLMPDQVRVTELAHGSIIETTPTWFDPRNAEDVGLAKEVASRLLLARLLKGPDGSVVD